MSVPENLFNLSDFHSDFESLITFENPVEILKNSEPKTIEILKPIRPKKRKAADVLTSKLDLASSPITLKIEKINNKSLILLGQGEGEDHQQIVINPLQTQLLIRNLLNLAVQCYRTSIVDEIFNP